MDESPTEPRVLVVSDDADVSGFLGRLLEQAGIGAATCPVADAANELASSTQPFDAVLADSIGDSVVRGIRNLTHPDRATTPMVILARYKAADRDRDTAQAAGADVYLTRPIVDHELVDAVRSVLPTATEPE